MADNEQKRQDLEKIYEKQMEELQRISGLTEEQAKQQLLNDLDKEISQEKAQLIRDWDIKAKSIAGTPSCGH